MRSSLAIALCLCASTLAAQPVRTTAIANDNVWSDPVQLQAIAPDGTVWPVGPYANRARNVGPWEPWTMFRTDRTSALFASWTGDWTPFTNDLSATLYADFAGYRRAWFVASKFDVYGPACNCWTPTQGAIHETLGLPTWGREWGAFPSLLDEATWWDANVGQWLDWSNVYVVTDVTGELEFITGTPGPGLPPDPAPVPEPSTLLLLVAGVGALALRRAA
jgi:hypothetical protein